MLNTNEFPKKAGRIFPPLVNIEYGVVTPEDVEEGIEIFIYLFIFYLFIFIIIFLGIEMDFEFKVSYKMEMREAKKDIEVLRNLCFTKSRNLSFIVFKKKEAQIFRESEY